MNNIDYLNKNIHPITVTVIGAGGNGSLLGEEPDYYNVEIQFDLWPTVSGGQPFDPAIRP